MSQAVAEQTRKGELETSEPGTLADVVSLYIPKTIRHADEITAEREHNFDLRATPLWTGDGPLYTREKFSLTRASDNLILNNLEGGTTQLRTTGNYLPSAEDAERVIRLPTTLTVSHGNIRLQYERGINEWGYIPINTSGKNKFNTDEAPVVERVYGKDGLRILRSGGIQDTRIWILRQDYAESVFNDQNASAIARGSRLGRFGGGSWFIAGDCGVDLRGALRAVRRVAAEDGSPQIDYAAIPKSRFGK